MSRLAASPTDGSDLFYTGFGTCLPSFSWAMSISWFNFLSQCVVGSMSLFASSSVVVDQTAFQNAMDDKMQKAMGYCDRWGVRVEEHEMITMAEVWLGPTNAYMIYKEGRRILVRWEQAYAEPIGMLLHELSHVILGGNPNMHGDEHLGPIFALDRAACEWVGVSWEDTLREYAVVDHNYPHGELLWSQVPLADRETFMASSLAQAIELEYLWPDGTPRFLLV